MIVRPAYGAKYETEEEVLNAWASNKDFILIGGRYINIKDFYTYCEPTLDSISYSYKGLNVPLNTGILI